MKEQVEEAIRGEIDTRFSKADSAQVCQGALFELLGYPALAILEGTFSPPPRTTAVTRIVLEEIARIWERMGMCKVSIEISHEEYQYYWKQAKERTA